MFRTLVIAALLTALPAAAQQPVLTLEQAWDRALADSLDLAAVKAALVRSRAVRRRTIAAMLPSLSANGTYRLNDDEVSFGGKVIRRRHELSGALRLDLNLFDGRAAPAYKSATQLVGLAELNLEDARQALMVEVARAYYTVLAAEALQAVALKAVEARKSHVTAAVARETAGHAVRLDVERARAAVHRAEREALDTRHQLAAARDGLALVLGGAPPLTFQVVRPRARPLPTTIGTSAEAAYERRLELRVLRGRHEVAERGRFGTWLSFLPALSLTGNLDFSEESFSRPESITPSLTLNVSWLLYDGGMRYAQLDEDQAAVDEALAALRKQRNLVGAQVLDAIRAAGRGRAAIRTVEAERAAAGRALDAATAAFRLGNANSLDVIDAQLALQQAAATLATEELQLDLAFIVLRRAVGVLRLTE